MMTPLLLGNQSYQSRSEAAQGQRLVNLYAETLPKGSPYPFLLIGRQGLSLQVEIEVETSVGIRGMREFNGNLFVVAGTQVYKVFPNFSYSIIAGVIDEDGQPVIMRDNGFELAILTTNGSYYVVDTADVLTQIFLPFTPTSLEYAYKRMIAGAVNASRVALIYPGELVDATAFDVGAVTEAAEVSDLIVRIISHNNIIYIMKETSIEHFGVTEDANAPFQQIPSSTKSYIGLLAKFGITVADKYLFWLGSDKKIYAAEGYQSLTVSTPAIDYHIAKMAIVSDCRAFYLVENGHKFVVFDFPSGQKTFAYDLEEQLWHERTTFGSNRWEVGFATFFNGDYILGSSTTFKLYKSENVFSDDDGFIEYEAHTPPIGEGTIRQFFNRLQLNFKRGVGNFSGQGTDPQVMLQYTDDGGKTYSNEQWRSIGMIGHYEGRSQWHKQGASRQRSYKVRITDKVEVIITGFYGDIAKGLS